MAKRKKDRKMTKAQSTESTRGIGYRRDSTDVSYPRGVADTYISAPDVSDPDAFAARVFGDSMTPKYREGDIVIFSPNAAVKNGDDAFVRFADGNDTTFKRVFYESDDKGQDIIRLQPRNERYRPQIVPVDKLTGVWRAVFRYGSVEDAEPSQVSKLRGVRKGRAK